MSRADRLSVFVAALLVVAALCLWSWRTQQAVGRELDRIACQYQGERCPTVELEVVP